MPDLFAPQDEQRLAGEVVRVIYAKPETLYTVVLVAVEGREVVAVGPMGALAPGERLILSGRFKDHPIYGPRLEVSHFEVRPPQARSGIQAYLGSGIIPGLGKTLAQRVVARFGEEALDILHQDPDRLQEVAGIGPQKLAQIKRAVQEKRQMEGLAVFLQSHDLPLSLARRLFKRYGPKALAQVRSNPYVLAREVSGLGFARADELALKLGFERHDPLRLEAGLIQSLETAAEEGDLFLPYEDLLTKATALLKIDQEELRLGLAGLMSKGRLIVEDMNPDLDRYRANFKAVYLPALHWAESQVAAGVERLLKSPGPALASKAREILSRVEIHLGLSLTPAQREALVQSLTSPMTIITGGPGTGKTTILKALVRAYAAVGVTPALAAPTGRAAKRLALAAARPALTIHRLLEYAPDQGFKRHAKNRLKNKAVVVDEASMVDVDLMAHLVQALEPDASLVLVGDADQLPPVGPGRVLADLIASRRVGVVRLEKVFRQAEKSGIIRNAHRIRQGRMPLWGQDEDFFFIEQNDPQRAARIIVELAAERIPKRFGFDPFREVQILSPMRRGVCGVEALNKALQETLNPDGRAVASGRFRLGDKVIQTRNNYERMTFNGDVGLIEEEIDSSQLVVDMEGEKKIYGADELDELTLAYCLSVHKAQGSEYQAVVAPLVSEHTVMLKRNLLYTAMTRAKALVVIVGARRALSRAVTYNPQALTNSLLALRLSQKWG